jgi:hypothetical protein
VQEIIIDYSDCATQAPVAPAGPSPISDKVSASFKSSKQTAVTTWQRTEGVNLTGVPNTTVCSLFFEIPEPLGAPVFLYYRLTNFYQNHRRYVQSLDINQLKGQALDNHTIDTGTCDPLRLDPVTKKAYYPCGLIANSLFNDSISTPTLINNGTYEMTDKGIAWDSDKQLFKKTQYNASQVVPPPNWHARYPDGYTEENLPDLQTDEAFMVWMRTAGLPTFSKLSRRNDTMAMPAGTYRLDIGDCKRDSQL